MTEEILTEEYLRRFPTKLHTALENTNNRRRFLNTVQEEYHPICVYRGLHDENKIDENDFICVIDEAEVFDIPRRTNHDSIISYSISVNEDPLHLIKSMHIPNKRRKIVGIAEGIMDSQYGPADFVDGASHHNWYIFEDSKKILVNKFIVKDVKKFKGEKNEECRSMG